MGEDHEAKPRGKAGGLVQKTFVGLANQQGVGIVPGPGAGIVRFGLGRAVEGS